MNLIREITVYERYGEELIKSFEIKLDLSVLIEILNIDTSYDPDILRVYSLDKNQFLIFSELIPELQPYSYTDIEAFYECSQI